MLRIESVGAVHKIVVARSIMGRGIYHTAAYWIDGLLVDTGCAHTAGELVSALEGLPVDQVVNTHCHEDHIGGNGPLQRARGVTIRAHPMALPILAEPRRQYLQAYRRLFWGWPEPSHAVAVEDWVVTPRYRFQVLETPGHCPDHICLYEPQEGWLFSGDAYIGGQERAARPDYDFTSLIKSLRMLASLRIDALFPGSGTVRLGDPRQELVRKVADLEALGDEARRLRTLGHSVSSIKRQLLGREPAILYLTLGHFRGDYLIRGLLNESLSAGGDCP